MTLDSLISVDDLFLAYRKAKADRYYEREHAGLLDLCVYEENLGKNLARLHKRLIAQRSDLWADSEFLGTHAYIPKTVAAAEPDDEDDLVTVHSSSEDSWMAANGGGGKPTIDFRLVGVHSVDFHVVSALWLMKVGAFYDATLSASAFGSRLRLLKKKTVSINEKAVGLFQPYANGFRKWRESGIRAASKALDDGEAVAAVTADLRKFYHRTSPSFLLDDGYLKQIGLTLTEGQRAFTEQLLQSMRNWAATTPEHSNGPDLTLSVGLSASRLIANCALWEFDRFVEEELDPVFYGRYVDDVILVLRNKKKWQSADAVWEHIASRSKKRVSRATEESGGKSETVFRLRLTGLEKSNLVFAGKKQKVFLLAGSSGRTHLKSIRQTVTRRTSEWRLLPDLPESADELVHDFIDSSEDWSEDADHLRKSDGLTIRRLSFAIRLRNLEGINRAIPPDQWRRQRAAFFEVVRDYVVAPKHLATYAPYIPRLMGLAASSRDWAEGTKLAKRLEEVFEWIGRHASESGQESLASCQAYLFRRIAEAVLAACRSESSPGESKAHGARAKLFRRLRRLSKRYWPKDWDEDEATWWRRLFQRDLAREPYRTVFTRGREDDGAKRSDTVECPSSLRERLGLEVVADFLNEVRANGREPTHDAALPSGLVYVTRPFVLNELTTLLPTLLDDGKRLIQLQVALRGGGGSVVLNVGKHGKAPFGSRLVGLTSPASAKERRIAVTCFETRNDSWKRMARGETDPDWGMRLFRFTHLINQVLTHNAYSDLEGRPPDGAKGRKNFSRVDYIVLPELSIPSRWVDLIARGLAKSGISLIAGVEYVPHPGVGPCQVGAPFGRPPSRKVSNQVHMSLAVDPAFASYVVLVQEKTTPALHEEQELARVADAVLEPIQKPNPRYLVHHGGFAFSVLICSELLNVDYRSMLRGHVDGVFVPEWNPDVDSFSALVESASLDVHCYMIQVNNRQFGDCRIRGPYKEPYQRDVARIRGGESDYFVVGRVEIEKLRKYQSAHRSPAEPFKPVPDGFTIAASRRVLP